LSRFLLLFSVTLSLFFLTITACGVKAPPSFPRQEFPLKVEGLQSEFKNGDLHLSGNISGLKESEGALDLIKGCRLFYADYSFKAQPCVGCPIDYHGFHEFGHEVISLNGLALEVPKKMIGEVSFFKVHLKGPKGALGPPSNTVKVETEQD
jgi:hypothetical protein